MWAEINVNHLKEVFEGMRVVDITTPKINAYIEKRLSEGTANGTINRQLSALKRMLTLGAQQTPPKVAQIPYIPRLRENNVRKGFFEYWEFVALRDNLPEYLKGLVTFAYKMGWRYGEIIELTWDRVDMINGIVRLEAGETKNDAARTVYLDDELKEVFRKQLKAHRGPKPPIPYVFPNRFGTDKISRIDRAWATACEEAGIGKRLFHDFRRTAVRNMVRSGTPETVAMRISGHKDRRIFERYNIVSEKDLQDAAWRQEKYLQKQLDTISTGTISGTIANLGSKEGGFPTTDDTIH